MMPETTITVADLKRNQYLLLGYFLYTTFYGGLRKWVFFGNSAVGNVLFTFQLLMPFLLFYFMKREKSAFTYPFLVPYTLLLIAFALNPMNQTLFHGLFGFLQHFGFWLVMLTYVNERDLFPVEKLIPVFLVIGFGEVFFSFIQFSLPPSHVINSYVNADAVDGFINDGGVRVIGTFSYIAGFGSFLFFLAMMIWALVVQNRRPLIVLLFLAVFNIISTLMNGSRSIMFPVIIFLFFGFVASSSFFQKAKSLAIVLTLIALGLIYNIDKQIALAEKAFNSFAERVETGQKTGEHTERTLSTFKEVTEFRGKYPLLGIGLGATYQGATNTWGRSPELVEYGYCENEPARIVLEGGFLLFIVRLVLFGYLVMKLNIPFIFSSFIMMYVLFYSLFVFNTHHTTFVFFGLILLDKIYYLKKNPEKQEDLSLETT